MTSTSPRSAAKARWFERRTSDFFAMRPDIFDLERRQNAALLRSSPCVYIERPDHTAARIIARYRGSPAGVETPQAIRLTRTSMTSAKRRHPNADAPVLWHAVISIIAVHLLGALGIWYLWAYFHAATVVLALGMFVLVHLSISAGLHRLYSHKAYRATKPLEIFLGTTSDIAKWFIELCNIFGLASGLRSMPESAVLLRAQRKASQARGPS
jgi:hypothetical protein